MQLIRSEVQLLCCSCMVTAELIQLMQSTCTMLEFDSIEFGGRRWLCEVCPAVLTSPHCVPSVRLCIRSARQARPMCAHVRILSTPLGGASDGG
jgi:hypothetical protein